MSQIDIMHLDSIRTALYELATLARSVPLRGVEWRDDARSLSVSASRTGPSEVTKV